LWYDPDWASRECVALLPGEDGLIEIALPILES
jgi:hypothetical protein